MRQPGVPAAKAHRWGKAARAEAHAVCRFSAYWWQRTGAFLLRQIHGLLAWKPHKAFIFVDDSPARTHPQKCPGNVRTGCALLLCYRSTNVLEKSTVPGLPCVVWLYQLLPRFHTAHVRQPETLKEQSSSEAAAVLFTGIAESCTASRALVRLEQKAH